jgi:LysR family transcriptional regulator, benzoate and cis,cis-muconate-responsive activator of ben and cat genes
VDRIELRELRYFSAVAEARSFTAAAKQLHMAQPPLSSAIKKLEKELDVVLFNRTRSGVLLTPAGARLLREANDILRRVGEIGGVLHEHQANVPRIRLGSVTSALSGLLPLVLPSVTDLMAPIVYAMQERAQVQALHDNTIELGLYRSRRTEGVHHIPLFDEPLYIALPVEHVQASRTRVELSALASEPFIMFSRDRAPVAFDAVTAACNRAGFSPRVVHTTDSDQMTFGLVACGIGISIVPELSTRMRLPGVVCLPLSDTEAITPLSVAVNEDGPIDIAEQFTARCRAAWERARANHYFDA